MSSKLDHALALASRGLHVFPIEAGRKSPPHIDDFPHRASRDPEQIRRWWTCPVMGFEQPFNIGVSTSRFGDDEALLVVDIDNKRGKHGDQTILDLEAGGEVLPATCIVLTPTGGRHLVYRTPIAVKQGVEVLGSGVDIRSEGGYVVGVGSTVDAGEYRYATPETSPAPAPDWLIAACGLREARPLQSVATAQVDHERAATRAEDMIKAAGPAAEGERNHKCFLMANWLKDLGVQESDCVPLLLEHWDCRPMLDEVEMHTSIASAYLATKSTFGSASPEVQFSVVRSSLLRKLLDFCGIR